MPRRSALPAGVPLLAIAALALAAGCSAPATRAAGPASPPASGQAGRACGSGKTAAGVKVMIMIERGRVACPEAQTVERGYASAIASGKVAGNGGGAPVTVQGWVCQGFNTPQVLRTGNTSRCVKGSDEILAVLPTPAVTPS